MYNKNKYFDLVNISFLDNVSFLDEFVTDILYRTALVLLTNVPNVNSCNNKYVS